MKNAFKIILSILLLFCLADMPYGYYELVRFASLVGFGILAFIANEEKKPIEATVYIALALLFQPFFKIALGRTIWNVVDVIVALYLLATLLISRNPKKNHDPNIEA